MSSDAGRSASPPQGVADGAHVTVGSGATTSDLSSALGRSGVSALRQDASLRYEWGLNLPAAWPAAFRPGVGDAQLFAPDEAARLTDLKQLVLRSGKPVWTELSLTGDGSARHFELVLEAAGGGVLSTLMERTRERRQEETMKGLLREVSHRSKNLLAIIMSIATQTGRHSSGIDEFLARFQGRLQSLASSQDLVTSSNWRGTTLSNLISAQIEKIAPERSRAVTFSGVDPWLDPNAALHLGLGIHELAANSIRLGALSRPEGRIEVTASLSETQSGRILVFRWSEPVPGGLADPGVKRFGSLALERVVPASVDGTASITFDDGRLVYELSVPEGQFSLD
jgi:two-component sensor histidine kinase